jgi:hypothetical protein
LKGVDIDPPNRMKGKLVKPCLKGRGKELFLTLNKESQFVKFGIELKS